MYSPITKSNPAILHNYSKTSPYTSLEAKTVYSISSGVVVWISKPIDSVIIQFDFEQCFRYSNLRAVGVKLGDIVQAGEVIGVASKYVNFEYLTATQRGSIWPVYIGDCTFYKQDTKNYIYTSDINNNLAIENQGLISEVTPNIDFESVTFTKEMLSEYDSNNRVDDIPNSV